MTARRKTRPEAAAAVETEDTPSPAPPARRLPQVSPWAGWFAAGVMLIVCVGVSWIFANHMLGAVVPPAKQVHEVYLRTDAPSPNPAPLPGPAPDSNPFAGLAEDCRRWAESVRSDDRRREAMAMGEAIGRVLDRADDGAFDDESDPLVATFDAVNVAAKGAIPRASLAAWKSAFNEPLTVRLAEYAEAGLLETAPEFIAAMRQVCLGLTDRR